MTTKQNRLEDALDAYSRVVGRQLVQYEDWDAWMQYEGLLPVPCDRATVEAC